MNLLDSVRVKFAELYGGRPLIVRSPGRVNLIGEHTDYNMGFVLPAAIEKAIYFAIAPRKDTRCRTFALDISDEYHFALNELHPSAKGWPNYLMGVVDQFVKGGFTLTGFDCVFGGDIPIGAGLSSSAALEAGLAFALNHVNALGMDRLALVTLAQKAENEFVGVRCGIMDQYINIFGQSDQVLRIDCRSLKHAYYPFDRGASIVLFNTGVSHSLASSEYNRRRQECARGVEVIRGSYPVVTHLRDVTLEMLEACRGAMEPTTFRRCKYVIEENDRVLDACSALEVNDMHAFGALMYKSHDGLSKDYEVSCEELDCLVDLVKDDPCVYGARMMGGGFGGCTINLVRQGGADLLSRKVLEGYKKRFNVEPKMYVTSLSEGTRIIAADAYAND
jgi:galactokinase